MKINSSILVLAIGMLGGCATKQSGSVPDSSFAAMQKRGHMAMGVDQYASTHRFEATSDGGTIELQSDRGDSLDVAQIRAHLKLIQHAFETGDFTTPAFVHGHDMPGTSVMTAKHSLIHYSYQNLPKGGQLRITTSDRDALNAVHDFLEAQRSEHHAGQ